MVLVNCAAPLVPPAQWCRAGALVYDAGAGVVDLALLAVVLSFPQANIHEARLRAPRNEGKSLGELEAALGR